MTGDVAKRVSTVRILPSLREDAIRWCERLADDRSRSGWSIRFTHTVIESSPTTHLAWRAHCAAKERLGAVAPAVIWTEAARLLRSGWGDPLRLVTLVKSYKRETQEVDVAKKQTRRSISVSKTTYERAKTLAAKKGLSLSQFTEVALLHAIENFDRIQGA